MPTSEGPMGGQVESTHQLAADARRARFNLMITNLVDGEPRSDQLQAAISKYCRAIEASPAEIEPYLELAELCFQHDFNEQAAGVCTEVIEQDPQCARAYQLRGLAYSHLERRGEAIADCDQAVRLETSVQTLHTRADVLSWFEDYAPAIEDCSRAIEIEPDSAECYIKRSNLLAEWFHESEVDDLLRRAIADASQAMLLEPGNTDHIRCRGRSYLDRGRFDEAIADLTRCIELEPDFYLNYEIRGEAYLKVNQPELALQDLTRSIKLNPESTYSYEYRAKAYRVVGQLRKADEDEAKWRELDPFHWEE